ncbi:laccase-4-like protein [Carex littledalei]|uniref:Laccase-4-like protein n=1 Tax=Carex littledalei TaxID=544730 RepID=A0A833VG07_9POAL|nr:laccase-4-like protein [Carex littledalei]
MAVSLLPSSLLMTALAFSCIVLFTFPVKTESQQTGITRHYQFNIQMTKVTRLCETKSIVTVNGQFPGPKIVAREGDQVVVRVVNHVHYNISLHWHGVRQLRSAWADGPAYVTQCPIQKGSTYVYNFTIVGQRGTLWWHAHISWLRATLYGPIVILPKLGVPYPFVKPYKEVPIIFGEWWKADTEAVISQALQTGGGPNVSDAYTINGLPGPLYNCSAKGVWFMHCHLEVHTSWGLRMAWLIQMTNVTRLCETKSIVTVNGQFPGPKIVAREGDRVVVRVVNHVHYNISLHWHGVRQLRSAWADGPAYVTQCPIQKGSTYVYNFTIVGQRGTLWWHAHISWLRATVYGPIIILPKLGVPYPFVKPYKEVPIIFGEWWKADTEAVISQALQTGGGPNVSDAYTINGLPGPLYNCSAKGVWFMHCHLEVHTSWGLRMAWLVLDGNLPNQKLPPPPSDLPKC